MSSSGASARAGDPPALERNVPLADHTTLGVGGPASFFLRTRSVDELVGALVWSHARGMPTLFLGGGSNLLVSDRGFEGLVVSFSQDALSIEGERVRADAGLSFDALVGATVARGLAGLECLSGIPGWVGAVPIQNVGAYGQEVAEVIDSVDAVDRRTGEPTLFDNATCRFAYRDSVFKHELRGRYVITGVTFVMRAGGAPSLRYPELVRHFESTAVAKPDLADARSAVIGLRRKKSMVIDAADENRRSAGSFFTNPVVPSSELSRVIAAAERLQVLGQGESVPAFAAGEGLTKLSAGWLIERSGFVKGTTRGRVGLSTNHALALVNRGGATASELVAFAREVRDGVQKAFGVRLTCEPELEGFAPDEISDLTISRSRFST